jgi:hypothetical protein
MTPGLAKRKDDIVRVLFHMAGDRPGKGQHPVRPAQGERAQDSKPYRRMGRCFMTATDDRDVVPLLGKMRRQVIQIAFRTARGGMAHMYKRNPHPFLGSPWYEGVWCCG